jgi:hypothetical protein
MITGRIDFECTISCHVTIKYLHIFQRSNQVNPRNNGRSSTSCMIFCITCVIIMSLTLFWNVYQVTLMINNFIISSITIWQLHIHRNIKSFSLSSSIQPRPQNPAAIKGTRSKVLTTLEGSFSPLAGRSSRELLITRIHHLLPHNYSSWVLACF